MTPAKPRIMIHGNCQGLWLSRALKHWPDIAGQFEIVYVVNHGEEPIHARLKEPDFLASFTHVFWQTAPGCQAPEFVAHLPASCRQIRFPSLFLNWLWPTATYDPLRHKPEPGFPQGRFCYGDRLLIKLLDEGVKPEDLAKRYIDTDVNTIMPMDRFHEKSLAAIQANDTDSDIPVATLIESTFRTQQTFSANSHPNPVVLQHVALALARSILDRPTLPFLNPPFDTRDILGNQEIPLHPQVIRHFGLTWARPGMKWRYGAEMFTLEEYIRAYAENRAIPHEEGYEIWLRRAQRMLEWRNYPEAERILLKGFSLYPEIPVFLGTLAMLFRQQQNIQKAEQVLRHALQFYPNIPKFHSDLGMILMQRRLPEEASKCFMMALKLNPSCKQTEDSLALAIKWSNRLPSLSA